MKKYGFIGPLLGLDWYIGDNRGADVILTSPANLEKFMIMIITSKLFCMRWFMQY